MGKILSKFFDATTPGLKLMRNLQKQAKEEHTDILAQNEQSSNASKTDGSEFANTDSEAALKKFNFAFLCQNLSPIKFYA